MVKKVWAKKSYNLANTNLNFGYYVGALPVKWNNVEYKLEPLTSRWELSRWICTTLFLSVWQIAIIINFLKGLLPAENVLYFIISDPIRLGYTFLSCIGIFLQLHTAWMYKELASFTNSSSQFYENFKSKYATRQERKKKSSDEDTISGIIKTIYFIGMLLVSVTTVSLYLLNSQSHILCYAFPYCDLNLPPYTKIPIRIIGCLLQFYFVAFHQGDISLYIDLFMAVVVLGAYMIEEMREMPQACRRTKLLLLRPEHWFRCYRSLEIIVKHLNDCIGQILMPVHMVSIVLGTSFVVVSLLRNPTGLIAMQIGGIVVMILISLYYIFVIGRGSKFSSSSLKSLESMSCNLTSEYFVKKHLACKPIYPVVGSFFPLKQCTVVTMYQSSIDFSCDLLMSEMVLKNRKNNF